MRCRLRDVGQPRHVVEDQRLLGQQRCDHQRQRGVLCARNRNGAIELAAADDANAIHPKSRFLLCPKYRANAPDGKSLEICGYLMGLGRFWPRCRPASRTPIGCDAANSWLHRPSPAGNKESPDEDQRTQSAQGHHHRGRQGRHHLPCPDRYRRRDHRDGLDHQRGGRRIQAGKGQAGHRRDQGERRDGGHRIDRPPHPDRWPVGGGARAAPRMCRRP